MRLLIRPERVEPGDGGANALPARVASVMFLGDVSGKGAPAALYAACRQNGVPRTLDEIAQSSTVHKKEVGRSYRFLIKELNYSIPPLKPSQYITKFSNQLTMQGKVEEIAHKILAAAKELKLTSGRGPTGIAAAASYVASVLTGERKTQREIAEIAQVTEVTIRNRYKELVERMMFQISI